MIVEQIWRIDSTNLTTATAKSCSNLSDLRGSLLNEVTISSSVGLTIRIGFTYF